MTFFIVHMQDAEAFSSWREKARYALQARLPPENIVWQLSDASLDLFAAGGHTLLPEIASTPEIRLRSSLVALLRDITCHADQERFSFAYHLAWRAQKQPHLASMTTDPDIAKARKMAHQVCREMHKTTAFVRFREYPSTDSEETSQRRRFVAWFEPEHYILERVAPFFKKRFVDMDWIILTPKGSLVWDGVELKLSSTPCQKPSYNDDVESLWATYFASTFNPARLRIKAMRNEMPRRYWKNLPEASLIPDLISQAEGQVAQMIAQKPMPPPRFHSRMRK